jgi:pilus assembly protein Flp/PilA
LFKLKQIDLLNLRWFHRIFTGLNESQHNPAEVELKRIFVRFLSDQSGATAIEYGLIAAGIALAIITAVNGLGVTLSGQFTSINTSLK